MYRPICPWEQQTNPRTSSTATATRARLHPINIVDITSVSFVWRVSFTTNNTVVNGPQTADRRAICRPAPNSPHWTGTAQERALEA